MRVGKERPIFRNLVITVAGDLGGGQWTDTNISKWVGLRDGKFYGKELNGGVMQLVTHLVCSEEEFRRRGRKVKEALKRQRGPRKTRVQVVTRDWLEDSMHKRKRLDEEPFSHLRVLKQEREKALRLMRVKKGLEMAEKMVNTNLYHLYRDHTFFQYNVLLTRDDEETGIQGERYNLVIYESNSAKPHLYWFMAKYYKKKGASPMVYRPNDSASVFSKAFAQFESLFLNKTGIPWAQRLLKAKTTDKRLFRYTPPSGGKPVGWVPAEFVPAEEPEDDVANSAADEESDGEEDEQDELSRLDESATLMDIHQVMEDLAIPSTLEAAEERQLLVVA